MLPMPPTLLKAVELVLCSKRCCFFRSVSGEEDTGCCCIGTNSGFAGVELTDFNVCHYEFGIL